VNYQDKVNMLEE